VLLVSDYLYIDSIAKFLAGFLGLVSRSVTAAVIGDYNLTIETISLEKFTSGFDVSPDFAAFVKRRYDDR
jgi:plasmid maintenance system antidote protein VapI